MVTSSLVFYFPRRSGKLSRAPPLRNIDRAGSEGTPLTLRQPLRWGCIPCALAMLEFNLVTVGNPVRFICRRLFFLKQLCSKLSECHSARAFRSLLPQEKSTKATRAPRHLPFLYPKRSPFLKNNHIHLPRRHYQQMAATKSTHMDVVD